MIYRFAIVMSFRISNQYLKKLLIIFTYNAQTKKKEMGKCNHHKSITVSKSAQFCLIFTCLRQNLSNPNMKCKNYHFSLPTKTCIVEAISGTTGPICLILVSFDREMLDLVQVCFFCKLAQWFKSYEPSNPKNPYFYPIFESE